MWLFGMQVVAACGRLGFASIADDPANTDALDAADDATLGTTLDAALDSPLDAAVSIGPFSPPIQITGVNSTSQDYGPSLSGDSNELVFASDRGTSFDLYRATRMTTADFTDLAVITSLRTSSGEYDPEISANGLELYFVSSASPAGLRRSTRATLSDPWESGTIITLGAGTEGPSLGVGDMRMLIEKSGSIQEWMRPSPQSTSWQVAQTHASLAGMKWPAFSEDGLEVFVTRKPGDELFRATRATLGEPFGTPQRYLFGTSIDNAPIYDPELSRDGRTLYLSINTGGSPGLYVTTR